MQIVWGILAGLVYTIVVFWAGKRYGNNLADDAHAELEQLRARLGSRVAGSKNPYQKIG